jgi:hypothetical protein
MAAMTMEDAITRLRTFIKDTPALNVLESKNENENASLQQYIEDAFIEINSQFGPTTRWKWVDVVWEIGGDGTLPWTVIQMGAVLQALISNGILSSRNVLTYNDASNVQVSDFDKYGRYINFYNLLVNRYQSAVVQLKARWNIDQCFGGIYSQLDQGSRYLT